MNRRLVIFDLDGTLVDSQDQIVAALRHAYAQLYLVPPGRSRLLSIVGLSLPQVFAELSPDCGPDQRAALVTAYKSAFVRNRADDLPKNHAQLYQGAREIVETLGADPGTVLGIATGKARRGVDHFFGVHGLGPHFATVQTADDHPSKPDPSMILAAMAQTGIGAEATWMVGDTAFDIAMGRAAGVRTVAVDWGYHPRERLAAAGADAIIDDFAALQGHLGTTAQRGVA